MKKQVKNLQLEQLDRKISQFVPLQHISPPSMGWINAIRTALNMSLRQFAQRLGISINSAKAIEKREMSGSITIQALQRAARALDMNVVYAVIPKNSTLEELIEQQAKRIAKDIVQRTSHSMELEDQKNSNERLEKAIQEKTNELKRERSKLLWD